MQSVIFFDTKERSELYPLTFTRPVSELRVGIFTGTERWRALFRFYLEYLTTNPAFQEMPTFSWHTEAYMNGKYATHYNQSNYLINGAIIGNTYLLQRIVNLPINTVLLDSNEVVLAAHLSNTDTETYLETKQLREDVQVAVYTLQVWKIKQTWDIFQLNQFVLELDFEIINSMANSQPVSATNLVLGDKSKIFLEEGAKVEGAILNTQAGPIYIGKDAEVMEGSIIRGGFALCEGAQTKLGTKIYGATTIGPHSKVGGEVSNSVIQGYSNKGHDGFLGNSVLGEWCNLGAGTNTSNLKNNYGEVQVWSYNTQHFEYTGTQFCGLVMGDHSKCSINTMFNTGTVVGVSANIFGDGFPRKFVPSFSWGGAKGFSTYQLDKVFETAELVMQRRHLSLSEADKAILQAVFDREAVYRIWDRKNEK